jgi:hypothetical protein
MVQYNILCHHIKSDNKTAAQKGKLWNTNLLTSHSRSPAPDCMAKHDSLMEILRAPSAFASVSHPRLTPSSFVVSAMKAPMACSGAGIMQASQRNGRSWLWSSLATVQATAVSQNLPILLASAFPISICNHPNRSTGRIIRGQIT